MTDEVTSHCRVASSLNPWLKSESHWLKCTHLHFPLHKHRLFFIFIRVFLWKTILCMKTKTYLSVPKYIFFAHIIHRLQTVWNQTKSHIHAKSRGEKLTILVHTVFCHLHLHWINTAQPPKHKLHLKSPKHFILLASFHLNVYTKISISSPLYNAVFNIQVSISMIKRSQWLCYVCVKEFPISYYIKIFHI